MLFYMNILLMSTRIDIPTWYLLIVLNGVLCWYHIPWNPCNQLNCTWGVPSRSVRTIKGGGGPSNTTVIIWNNDVKSYIRATCFDSTESSSGPRVSDPYKERTTHCGIPNAYNKNKITKLITIILLLLCLTDLHLLFFGSFGTHYRYFHYFLWEK